MKVEILSVGGRERKDAFEQIARLYIERTAAYVSIEARNFRSEEMLFEWIERQKGRTAPFLVLLDSRGKAVASEDLASWLGEQRDGGRQTVIFAVGPADGWSEAARKRADRLLSFGPMTLPHELARVVLAEQVYRAFTILAGHPYHGGH